MPRLNSWSMELEGYNLMFVHNKGKNNVLADAISGSETLDIYKEPLESPKHQQLVTCKDILWNYMQLTCTLLCSAILCTEQKWDIMCKKLASQLCHNKKVALGQL